MNVLLAFLGLALVASALVDVFCSLVRTPLRAGPFTTLGERIVCRNLYRAFRLTGRRNLLAAIGPASVASRAFMVLLALFAGWSLVLFSHEGWVVVAKTGEPASVWQRFYFVGYTISTLGLGDVVPNAVPARLATVGASLSGFVVITFVVGSISPLSDVIAARNAVIATVRAFDAAVAAGADEVDAFDCALDLLVPPLIAVATAIETLPVRHRMHAEREHLALSIALRTLEKAATHAGRESDLRVVAVRDAIDRILDVLNTDWLDAPKGDRATRLQAYVDADALGGTGASP